MWEFSFNQDKIFLIEIFFVNYNFATLLWLFKRELYFALRVECAIKLLTKEWGTEIRHVLNSNGWFENGPDFNGDLKSRSPPFEINWKISFRFWLVWFSNDQTIARPQPFENQSLSNWIFQNPDLNSQISYSHCISIFKA